MFQNFDNAQAANFFAKGVKYQALGVTSGAGIVYIGVKAMASGSITFKPAVDSNDANTTDTDTLITWEIDKGDYIITPMKEVTGVDIAILLGYAGS